MSKPAGAMAGPSVIPIRVQSGLPLINSMQSVLVNKLKPCNAACAALLTGAEDNIDAQLRFSMG